MSSEERIMITAQSIIDSRSEYPKVMVHNHDRNNGNFHWAGSNWACADCRVRGDIFHMQSHFCKGKDKDKDNDYKKQEKV